MSNLPLLDNINDIVLLNNQGTDLVELGKYSEALNIFEKALQLNSSNTHIYYNKGICLMRLTHYELALECFKRLLEIEPNHLYAIYNTGIILSKLNRNEDTQLAFQKASILRASLTNSPTTNTDNMGEAVLQMLFNNRPLALQCINEAIQKDPSNLRLQYLKALILLEDPNNYHEAEQILSGITELQPDNDFADTLESLISTIKHIRNENIGIIKMETEQLHKAVLQNDINKINELIVGGLSIYLTDDYFRSAVDLAAEMGRWNIVNLLLSKSEKISCEDIYEDVMYCSKCYDVSFYDNEQDETGLSILDEFCSKLSQQNIFDLRINNGPRYLAHLNRIAGIYGNNIKITQKGTNYIVYGGELLEGWLPQHFLPLRARVYFGLLVKLRSKEERLSLPFGYEDKVIRHFLEEELDFILETNRIKHDMLLIMSALERYRQNLIDTYATNLTERVLQLKNGETLCINSGHRTHSLYINFIQKEGKFFVRIDNLGHGCNRHPQVELKLNGNLITGRTPYLMSLEDNKRDFLHKYFSDLFYAKHQAEPEEALSIIYFKEYHPDSKKLPASPQQIVGNCVVENHNVGIFLRQGNALADWLMNKERQASAVLSTVPDFGTALDSLLMESSEGEIYLKSLSPKRDILK